MRSFDCACGRSQAYAPAHQPGGITDEEAVAIGWRREQGRWLCPFCSGNARDLRKVVEGKLPGLVARHAGCATGERDN